MAKKIRFPLQMNGANVRTIEELRENFDLESILGYFINGKLVTWLRNRYYDNEANAIEGLNINDTKLNKKIMSILGISFDMNTKEVDVKTIQRRNEKLTLLLQFTNDKEVIDNVDFVACNQNDLDIILAGGAEKIYLCVGEFEVPNRKIKLVGIGNPIVIINSNDKDSDIIAIEFTNIEEVSSINPAIQYQIGRYYLNGNEFLHQNFKKALELFKKSAEQNNIDAKIELGECYEYGKGTEKDLVKAVELYKSIIKQGLGSSTIKQKLINCYLKIEDSWYNDYHILEIAIEDFELMYTWHYLKDEVKVM